MWSLLILLIFQMLFAYVFSLVELLLLLTSVVIRLLICDSRHASALAEPSLLIWARPISICMLMYASCLRLVHQCYVPFPVRPVPWGGTRLPSSFYGGVGRFSGRVIHPVCVCVDTPQLANLQRRLQLPFGSLPLHLTKSIIVGLTMRLSL